MIFSSRPANDFTKLALVLLLVMTASGYQEPVSADTHDGYSIKEKESVTLEELDQLRGREGDNLISVQSLQDLKATASDNAIMAGSVLTGPITIEPNALSNFDGVGLFTIMTGNNNAVSTAVGISIYLSQ